MDVVGALVGCIILILIGMNAAVLYRFWPERWLTIKMVAVSSLLLYILLSVWIGHPDPWRIWLGLGAVLADFWALFVLAKALHHARTGEGVLIAYRRR
jgi:hypothetical protein